MQYMVGAADYIRDVVGDHYDRKTVLFVQVFYQRVHFGRRPGIKTRYRLVKEQQFSRGAQGSCQQHALLLASGKFSVTFAGYAVHSHPAHIFKRDVYKRQAEGSRKEFISAYVTDTRLMGVTGMYVHWALPENSHMTHLHQFFYFDAEECGFDTYRSVLGDGVKDEFEEIRDI